MGVNVMVKSLKSSETSTPFTTTQLVADEGDHFPPVKSVVYFSSSVGGVGSRGVPPHPFNVSERKTARAVRQNIKALPTMESTKYFFFILSYCLDR